MLSSVLPLFHSLPVCSLMLTHTGSTHSAPILVKPDIVSAKRMSPQAVSSSCMYSSLNFRVISSKLINRTCHWFQMKEVDTEFDSTQMIYFQPYWNRSEMEKFPTKSVGKNYQIFTCNWINTSTHATISGVSLHIFKSATCPNPVFILDFSVMPESFLRCASKVSGSLRSFFNAHKDIISPTLYFVKGKLRVGEYDSL
jgi:hypothetical protein